MLKGIDVSHHQGVIDYQKVKESGTVDFVIIREGYGTNTDNFFFQNVDGFRKVGIPILGVYHFSYAKTKVQAQAEARRCIENVQKAGLPKKTICFYDFEYDTIKKATAEGVFLTYKECQDYTEIFCDEVLNSGYNYGYYTNLDFYKNYYKQRLVNDGFLWLADYTGEPDYPCDFQQYSSTGSVPGIKGNVDMNYLRKENFIMSNYSSLAVVNLLESWIGKKVSDGSYKSIIDIYNSHSPLPRGIKMQYSWPWCAVTWSAAAISLGYTEIMPVEMSCGNLIELAKKMGCWQENDGYVPSPGDGVLYDWDDNGVGDNTGWPDHVGGVTYVNKDSGYFVVVEGNYGKEVKKRTVSINGRYIRGFITPKYDVVTTTTPTTQPGKDLKTIVHEVIAGVWGNGEDRKKALEAAGYNYAEVQAEVTRTLNGGAVTGNDINQNQPVSKKVTATCAARKFDGGVAGTYTTTSDLYCRNDAGKNKKALCLIPKGTSVKNYGYYTDFDGVKWLYIQFVMDGVQYTGFSSGNFLKKM